MVDNNRRVEDGELSALFFLCLFTTYFAAI